jgi:hypothetical protein
VKSSQPAAQHWFVGPTAHGASAAVQEQPLHASPLPLQYCVQVSG